MSRRKSFAYAVILTDHVFDRVRALGLTLGEFETVLGAGEIIEEHVISGNEIKEIVLLLEWVLPLHLVVVVDHRLHEERILNHVRTRPRSLVRRLPEQTLMRCERCDNGERMQARRARMAERQRHTAVVLDVPVEVCPACGQVWLTLEVAKRLDSLSDQLLASGAETSQVHWDHQYAA
jgi:YgiT-type zinc finger domain-containing protein